MRNPFASPLWQNSAFVRVWSAATISIFGSLITRMALPFVAILVLGAGAFEVALVRSIDLLAALLFGLIVGAWVDRLRRRPVMVWADLGRAVLLVTIPIAAVGGWLTLAQLLLVSFAVAILSTFFDAADNAYLPSIVPRDELVRANGALAASGSAAEFTAFGISGFLVQLLSAPLAIFIDAISFVVSALLLGSIRRPEPPPPPKADREPVLQRDPRGPGDHRARPDHPGIHACVDGHGDAVGRLRGDLDPVRGRRAGARCPPRSASSPASVA